jgi:hypothetical protein
MGGDLQSCSARLAAIYHRPCRADFANKQGIRGDFGILTAASQNRHDSTIETWYMRSHYRALQPRIATEPDGRA